MKILHTADLHLGQVLYQSYGRIDEHDYFFDQLRSWCLAHGPDALIVSGDVYDVQQPSAATRASFTKQFVEIHKACPQMKIIITAGNHDSASRLQADSAVWDCIGVKIAGVSPSLDSDPSLWQDDYIVDCGTGYVVAMPYMVGDRKVQLQAVLDRVAELNTEGKPVVMMAHTAVTGADVTGHGFEIGTLKTVDVNEMGSGWDYLALGHIHKPQTIGHEDDRYDVGTVTYDAPVARYSGSALHVSCDEAYPHSVSLVEINAHGGKVSIQPLRINELRHFHILPKDGDSFKSAEDALKAVKEYVEGEGGYFRLRIDYSTPLPPNFSQSVYDVLGSNEVKARFNPKIIWDGAPEKKAEETAVPTFEIADLQQMTDPVKFIEKTISQYQGLDLDVVRAAFEEVRERVSSNKSEDTRARVEKKSKNHTTESE